MSRWSCSSCPKSFTRKGDLTRHQSTHTGVKPHICTACGKGFAQYSGLKTHWNVHTKAKPYICGIGTCKKAFGDPSSCGRHRKETHRREGAYKCIVVNCGTRIKRRSAFVAHLRKHGLDPNTFDLKAIASQSSERGIAAPARFASPDAENKSHSETESRGTSASVFGEGSGHRVVSGGGQASYSMDGGRWSGSDDPLDCRQADWPPQNDALLLAPMPDQTVNVGTSGNHNDIYTYLSSHFENPFCFDNPLLTVASPANLSTLQPFLETGSDGSQSTWSSPSSTCSAMYTPDFDGDVASLSLANDAHYKDPFCTNLFNSHWAPAGHHSTRSL